ncbi:MAG: hypothetical protein QXT92_01135 [Nitrososphaerota archaeon]
MLKTVEYAKFLEYFRRYFAINAFDGTITIWGMIVGVRFLGAGEPSHVVSSGVGAIIAMVFSGLSSTYMIELAEQKRKLREIEEAMLMKIDNTEIEKAHKRAALISAFIDSFSSSLSSLLVLSPYVMALIKIIDCNTAFIYSTLIAFILLFWLGAFLGKIAEERLVLSGVKAICIGGGIVLITYLINLFTKFS